MEAHDQKLWMFMMYFGKSILTGVTIMYVANGQE